MRRAAVDLAAIGRAGQPRSQPNLGLGARGHGHRPAAWLSQSRSEYGTGWAKTYVSQKHEMRFFDDFWLALRAGESGGGPPQARLKQRTL